MRTSDRFGKWGHSRRQQTAYVVLVLGLEIAVEPAGHKTRLPRDENREPMIKLSEKDSPGNRYIPAD
jgi:hypothetical protein